MSVGERDVFSLFKNLVFEVGKDEMSSEEDEVREDQNDNGDEVLYRGGGGSSGDDDGSRSEYWYETLESRTKSNAERSRENQLILSRLDQRTTWMMRILLAIVTAGAVSYVAELMI